MKAAKGNGRKPPKKNGKKPQRTSKKIPSQNPNGRPRVVIDLKVLRALREVGCTDDEIAACLDISTDTIGRRKKTDSAFAEAYKRGLDQLKASLRRRQVQVAMTGSKSSENASVGMLIWLGKQLLGQTDKADHLHLGDADRPIAFKDLDPTEARELAAEAFPEFVERWERMNLFGEGSKN